MSKPLSAGQHGTAYRFPPVGPNVKPLSLTEWFIAFTLLCCSFSLFSFEPALVIATCPFFVFGLPGRIACGTRDGWIAGTLFGTVAFVACAFAVGFVAARLIQPSDLDSGLQYVFVVLAVSLPIGIVAAYRGGRARWHHLHS